MTESTPIAADSTGPRRTGSHQGQEEGAARSRCPACGFGTRQHDRFCRRCGINFDRWQSATTGSLYATAAVAQGNTEHLVSEQKYDHKFKSF